MKMNKRYRHNIKSSLSFYIASVLLTSISIFLFLSIQTTGAGLKSYMDDFSESHHMEDAQFAVLYPIDEDTMDSYETEYDLTLEKTGMIDVEEKNYTIRVLHRNESIDLSEIYEGKDVSADDEIVLSKGFATANDLAIGDSVSMNGSSYTITGFFLHPDYINCLKNLTDTYRDNEGFAVAMVSENVYQSLGSGSEYYTVIYHDEDREEDFRKEINRAHITLRYTAASVNPRIEAVQSNPQTFITMSYMMMCLMMVVISILVAAILSRKVKSERKMIGTMKALGYRNGELIRHYSIMALIAGASGTIVGLILAFAGAQPMAEYYAVDYEPMPIHYTVPLHGAILCIVMPTLFYTVAAVLTTRKLMKKNAVELLTSSEEGKTGSRAFAENRRMKFKQKFRLRSLMSNKGRTAAVLIGLIVGGYIMALGFTFIDSCDNFVTNSVDRVGQFAHRYYLNTYLTEDQGEGCEYAVSVTLQPKETTGQFSMNGLPEDSEYIPLQNVEGETITISEDQYYLTSVAAKVYDVSAGDKFTFFSPVTMEEYTVKITDIVDDNAQKMLYSSDQTVRRLFDLDDGLYNVVLSDHKLDLNDDLVAVENTKESIQDQMQSAVDDLKNIIYVMIILGIILCMAAVYLTVNMMLEESANTISMLKIFGYRKREISSMVLSANHILVPLSLVISIPLTILASDVFFTMMIDNLSAYIEPSVKPLSCVICAVLVILSYGASLTLLKRKVFRIDMVESLKDNRE